MLGPFTTALMLSLTSVGPAPVLHAVPGFDDPNCIVMGGRVEGRRSPLDSLTFTVQGSTVKVCYGRPSARGRTMIGGSAVPYEEIWRTGANEPTMIHTTVPLTIAGIQVDAGSYSLYTVPGKTEWQIVVNGSTSQWGHERNYTGDVAAAEIGRAAVPSKRVSDHVETFTIRAEPEANGNATMILEWEHTQVHIPLAKRS